MVNWKSGIRGLRVQGLVGMAHVTLNASMIIPDPPTMDCTALGSAGYKNCAVHSHVTKACELFEDWLCQVHNEGDIKWARHNEDKPERIFALVCLSNKYVLETLERRVKDGISFSRGSKQHGR
jgi:Fe-S-cluster containining protein